MWLRFGLLSSLWAFTQALKHNEMIENLLDWVLSAEHSYWNADKLEIRRADHGLGVFAKEDIPSQEVLMQIPPERYIHIMEDSLPTNGDEDMFMENYWKNVCQLATKLQGMIETSSTNSSTTNGYLEYLKSQSRGQLPVTWSAAGMERLRQILPEPNRADVLDWFDPTTKKFAFCTVDPDWIAMTIQRGYDVTLIPLWDMVNHHNGKVNVDTTSYYDANGLQVYANAFIPKGHEIYATYDKCRDCADVAEYWGTTEFLRDFGFVEDYPQRYTWDEYQIWFEIHHHDNGEWTVVWDDSNDMELGMEDLYYGIAKGEGLEFLRNQASRLESLQFSESCNAPLHECTIIETYQESLRRALRLALEDVESHNSMVTAASTDSNETTTCIPPTPTISSLVATATTCALPNDATSL